MSDGTPYNIIVKPYLSYDAGVPVGGHGKVASQTEDGLAHVTFIYLIYAYITTYKAISGTLFRAAHGIQYVKLHIATKCRWFCKIVLNLLEIVGRSSTPA